MYKGKKILGLITARGGSKGIPHKNIVMFCGKPLIAWTIAEAKKSRYIDRLILSSDDARIIKVAQKYGCEAPFVRPANLATDEATSVSVVEHAIDAIKEKYDYIVLLQPTSPLRVSGDIDAAIENCAEAGAASCVSVCEPRKSPFWTFRLNSSGRLEQLIKSAQVSRRQDSPKTFCLNGAIYVTKIAWFRKNKKFIGKNTVPYVMTETDSIDIDTPMDLKIAELFMKQKLKAPK